MFYEESLDNIIQVNEEIVVNNFLSEHIKNSVVIIAGSESDKDHCNKIKDSLRSNNIYSRIYYCSAHKNTKGVLNILDSYESQNRNIVYVTVAGMSNALSGVVTCNTRFPNIACPPFKDKDDMMVNINSTLQMPSKVPVMTVLSTSNVALAVQKIFNLYQ